MIVEYRLKFNSRSSYWQPMNAGTPFKDLNMGFYSVRINKDKQYHKLDTPGFEEEYNKALSWMKLTGKYDDEWEPW